MRLYPDDVRFSYGDEMVSDFDRRFADARKRGWPALAAFFARGVLFVLCDAAAERVNTLYSHRTFHGRCRPNPTAVRPPNMGKQEWFRSDAYDASIESLRLKNDQRPHDG